MKVEQVVHTYGECKCLPHETHIDRYFNIETPFTDERKQYLKICNSYIGLMLKETQIEKAPYTIDNWDYSNLIRKIIKETFAWSNECDVGYDNCGNRNIINRGFYFTICERPHICITFSIIKASEIILAKNATHYLITDYCNAIRSYIYSRKVLQKQYKDLFRLVSILDRRHDCDVVLDIANEIFNINIKSKKQ